MAAAEPTEATQQQVYPPPAALAKDAHVKSLDEYKAMYAESIDNPEKFFGEMARSNFYWEKPFDSVGPVYNFDMTKGPIAIDWFQGGKTNICYNALDKHVAEGHGDDVAVLWEGNSPEEQSRHTYAEMLDSVKKFANVLKKKGVGKGDTVTLYMPMVVELAVACLACARIGAVHSVVFGGFSPEAIRAREDEPEYLEVVDEKEDHAMLQRLRAEERAKKLGRFADVAGAGAYKERNKERDTFNAYKEGQAARGGEGGVIQLPAEDPADLDADDQEKIQRVEEEAARKSRALAERMMGDGGGAEVAFAGETPLESQVYWWHDKYRPRKPKYFNRVHTGYEWNKYNQTHYDHDNPPPKMVQGYKFNIFYPDLIDRQRAPAYQLLPDPSGAKDTCVIRFRGGPPYEDLAFKIVNREWEHSHKRGFKCRFERGILQLYFNFKRVRYRR